MAKMKKRQISVSLYVPRTSTENHIFRPYLIEHYPEEHLVIHMKMKTHPQAAIHFSYHLLCCQIAWLVVGVVWNIFGCKEEELFSTCSLFDTV